MRDTTLLLDTNVCLSYYLPDRKESESVHNLISQAIASNVTLAVAATTLKDMYYIMQSDLKRSKRQRDGVVPEADASAIREIAWGCIETLCELATVVPIDASDMWIARKTKRVHADFEGDLVVAAAMRANATYLVTNDRELILHAPVAALTPADALALIRDE